MRTIVCLVALSSLCACAHDEGTHDEGTVSESKTPTVPQAPWLLRVADGAANIWIFSQEPGERALWRYVPVRPEESSTGMYSGGEPKNGALTDTQILDLWRAAKEVAADAAHKIADRLKGTYAIVLVYDGRDESHLVDGGDAMARLTRLTRSFAGPP